MANVKFTFTWLTQLIKNSGHPVHYDGQCDSLLLFIVFALTEVSRTRRASCCSGNERTMTG